MTDTLPEADVPAEFTTLRYPLPHLAQAFQGRAPIRIVAMGSSSTAARWGYRGLDEVAATISTGLVKLRSQPAVVLLMDPQYVTVCSGAGR